MARDKATIQADIAALEAKVKPRRGKPGFSANVNEIDARLAELRAELAEADA